MTNETRAPRGLRLRCMRRASAAALALASVLGACRASDLHAGAGETPLVAPRTASTVSFEAALAARRPVDAFTRVEPNAADLSQLLWAAQGVLGPELRTVPSLSAPDAVEVWLARADGVHRYLPASHATVKVLPMDVRKQLARVEAHAEGLRAAPVLVVLTGRAGTARARHGERAERMVALEAGHAAQNVMLQAQALGLAAVPLGLDDDEAVRTLLVLPRDTLPLHVLAVGLPGR
jgi:SagB-type dehydrogenase family enzyme